MAILMRAFSRELPTATLPTEFLLFSAGVNRTLHGDFVFDQQSALDVMRDYSLRQVDYPIDLQHDSLDPDKRLMRNDAADAMGWFRPEVRADGSLWAVAVKWSAEGKRRLEARSQRYTSPAATFDRESRRITGLVNAALCSDPASYRAQPLMAASRTSTITARVPNKLRRQVQAVALARNTSVSALVTLAIGRAMNKPVPAALMAELLTALGLEDGATPEEIKAALTELIANIPDKTPAAPVDELPTLQLSAETLKQIKAKGWTIDQFLAARKAAVKRGE